MGGARHDAPMAEVMRGGRGLERCGADDGISTSCAKLGSVWTEAAGISGRRFRSSAVASGSFLAAGS